MKMRKIKDRVLFYGSASLAFFAGVIGLSVAALMVGVAVRVIWEAFLLGFNVL